MKIPNWYGYLFYKIFIGLNKIPFADDTTNWGAMLALSALIFINFLSLLLIGNIFYGDKFTPISNNRIEQTIILSLFIIPNYFFFIHKSRYKIIVDTYKNETTRKRKKGNLYVSVYIFGTVVLFFLLDIIKLIIWGKP
ncbi:MAG: hypothetical protein R6W68_10770 [Ignavibacteriaceae bacterium]